MAEDHAFQNTTLYGGLKAFRRDVPAMPLKQGETRFYVDTLTLPHEIQALSQNHKRRACIEDSNGDTRLAVPWAGTMLSKHQVLDLGSCSWPIQSMLYSSRAGCQGGTFDSDPPHRKQRYWLNAMNKSGHTYAMAEIHLELEAGSAEEFKAALVKEWERSIVPTDAGAVRQKIAVKLFAGDPPPKPMP